MKGYKGRGVVLHTLKDGDSSMVVYLLTDVGGRRSYMAVSYTHLVTVLLAGCFKKVRYETTYVLEPWVELTSGGEKVAYLWDTIRCYACLLYTSRCV